MFGEFTKLLVAAIARGGCLSLLHNAGDSIVKEGGPTKAYKCRHFPFLPKPDMTKNQS